MTLKVIEFLIDDLKVAPSDLATITRDVSKLESLSQKGVEVREADFVDVGSLRKAFSDVGNLLIISID